MSHLDENSASETLLILRDKDVFSKPLDPEHIQWQDRLTGKAVLFNERGEVALMGNNVHDFLLLPGGGIEESESVLEGLKRECREETGCEIEILNFLGKTEDFRARDGRHGISYGYSAKVLSTSAPIPTENEMGTGAYVTWLSLPDTIKLFALQEKRVKAGETGFYNTSFNVFRDSLFAQRAEAIRK